MCTVPSSSMLISAPDSAWMALMFLPPGPMSSPIFSGLIFVVSMRGAYWLSGFGAADGGVHHGEDVGAADLGLGDGFVQEAERDAGELEVELEAGDAVVGAAELEVHVAEVVFAADDVEHGEVAAHLVVGVELGDEADADAGDGAHDRHAGVEQGHDAGADRGHRGGAVGLHDFAGDADGVGEILCAGDDRLDGALGERAVADFAAALTADAAGFADGEGREVVVQDEALRVRAAGVGVQFLRVVGGASVASATACVSPRANSAEPCARGSNADFAGERAEVVEAASVAAMLLVEDADAEDFLLHVVEGLADFEVAGFGELGLDGGFDFIAQGADGLAAVDLAGLVERAFDAAAGDFVGDFEQLILDEHEGNVALGLPGLGGEFFLRGDEDLHLLLREGEGVDEVVFGDFVGRAFDHDDVGLVADIDEVEVALRHAGRGWDWRRTGR